MLFCENAHVLHRFGRPYTRKTGLRVEISESAALPFSCGQQIRILSKTMMPSPHPSTSCLRPLNPATSYDNNNNNNGGLHARVRAAEDIEPFLHLTLLVVECESQQQFDLINGPHKWFWCPCTSYCCLLLVVFGFTVSSSPSLVNFKCPL